VPDLLPIASASDVLGRIDELTHPTSTKVSWAAAFTTIDGERPSRCVFATPASPDDRAHSYAATIVAGWSSATLAAEQHDANKIARETAEPAA